MGIGGRKTCNNIFINLDSDEEDNHDSIHTEGGKTGMSHSDGVSEERYTSMSIQYDNEESCREKYKNKRGATKNDSCRGLCTGLDKKYQSEQFETCKNIYGGQAGEDTEVNAIEIITCPRYGVEVDCLSGRSGKKKRCKYGNEDVKEQAEKKDVMVPVFFEKSRACVKNNERLGTRMKEGKRYDRKCNRYLHKKNSPIILSDIIAGLSGAQREWMKKTGFAALLDFKMEKYPHTLGYNVVEAFDRTTCALRLRSGLLRISENVVKNVLGLPNGEKKINLIERQDIVMYWGKQFAPKPVYHVTPNMVYQKIEGTVHLTKLFKLNFLVLMSNYLIESNQGGYLSREILGYLGNLDACYEYNWCELLIRKLISAHEFWSVEPGTRSFRGSLPFLIVSWYINLSSYIGSGILLIFSYLLKYLYVDRVVSIRSGHSGRVEPAYKIWTDDLLRERQKLDATNNAFGVGIILQFSDEDDVHKVHLESTYRSIGNNARDVNIGIDEFAIVEDSYDAEEMGNDAGGDVDNEYDVKSAQETIMDTCTVIENVSKGVPDKNGRHGHAGLYHAEGFSVNKKMVHTPKDADMGQVRLIDDEVGTEHMETLLDAELYESLEEENIIASFEESVRELKDAYSNCITTYKMAFALYPDNSRIVELKQSIFDIFADSIISPLKKDTDSMPKDNVDTFPFDSQPTWPTKVFLGIDTLCVDAVNASIEEEGNDDAPNFSLGLTQLEPREIDAMDVGVIANRDLENEAMKYDVQKRSMIELRRVENLRTTYISGVVEISTRKLNLKERAVWEWMLQSNENQDEILFQWKEVACTREHFQSLQVQHLVMTTVIDTWSYLLNKNEIFRTTHTPLRLFCNTETTYGPLLKDKRREDERFLKFTENMNVVICMVMKLHERHYNATNFDMFFFPIFSNAHHYLIVYDIKYPSWKIIDNNRKSEDVYQNYGTLPFDLHRIFVRWMKNLKIFAWNELDRLEPVILKMPWQTQENSVDCGIFVMRHMETYSEFCGSQWNSGFHIESEEQNKQLDKLRKIYNYEILTSMLNDKRKEIIDAVMEYTRNNIEGRVEGEREVEAKWHKNLHTFSRKRGARPWKLGKSDW